MHLFRLPGRTRPPTWRTAKSKPNQLHCDPTPIRRRHAISLSRPFGLLISRICLGTMAFGMKDWGCDQATATEMVRKFIDGGGNFFDTADVYSTGVSEEMLGVAIRDLDRDDLVLATKCWFRMDPTPNGKGLSRKHIMRSIDNSLQRLGTDFIDLYQVHGPDWFTPLEETLRALDDAVRSGKVRYLGCSNYYAWQIVKANAIAEAAHLTRFISGQHMYNLIRRDIEREILPACADQGLGMLCWSPLGSGFLNGRYERGRRAARRHPHLLSQTDRHSALFQ